MSVLLYYINIVISITALYFYIASLFYDISPSSTTGKEVAKFVKIKYLEILLEQLRQSKGDTPNTSRCSLLYRSRLYHHHHHHRYHHNY